MSFKKISLLRISSILLSIMWFCNVRLYSQNTDVINDTIENQVSFLASGWGVSILMFIIIVALSVWLFLEKRSTRYIRTCSKKVFSAINTGNIMVWSYDVETGMLHNIEGKIFARDSIPLQEGFDMIHVDDVEKFSNAFYRLLEMKSQKEVVIMRVNDGASGDYRYYRNRMTVEIKNGEVVSVLGAYGDITEEQFEELKDDSIKKCLDMTMKSSKIMAWVYNCITNELEVAYGIDKGFDFRVSKSGYDQYWYIHPADKAKYKELIASVMSGKEKDGEIIVRMMRDGKYCYFNTILSAVRDNKDNVLYVVGSHKDLSSIYSLNEKINELYDESQVILDALPIGVLIYDKYRNLQYLNQAMANIFKIDNINECMAEKINLFSDVQIHDIIKEKIGREEDLDLEVEYYLNPKSRTVTVVRVEDDAQKLYVNARSRFVRNQKGEIISTVFIFNDVTSQLQSREIAEAVSGQLKLAMSAGQIAGWNYDTTTKMFMMIDEENSPMQLSCSELIGSIYDEDYIDFMELINNSLSSEESGGSIVLRSVDKDKTSYIESHVMRQDECHVIGTFRDITNDVLQKKEISEAKDMLNLAMEAGGVSAWIYNTSKKMFYSLHGEDIDEGGVSLDAYCRLMCEEDAVKLRETIDSITNGELDKINIVFKYKDVNVVGGFRYIRLHMSVKKEDGKIVYITGTRKDITEEYFAQVELREAKIKSDESNLLLSTILDRMPCVLFIKDVKDNYRYIMANKQFCDKAGKNEEEIVGHLDYEIFSGNDAVKFRKDDAEIIENDYIKMIEESVVWNGKDITWHTCKSPIKTSDGRKFLLGMSVDITDKNKMLEELQIAKEKAEQSDKLKSTFLANMSHEIRTPLNAIVGFSELLKMAESDSEKEEYFKIIDANNDLLLTLISDILDLSKIEAGYIDLVYSKFDLAEHIEDLAKTYKNRMRDNVEFVVENPYRECVIDFDKNRLTQVITNFINNAIKFTFDGYIKIGYELKDKGIRLYCTDTGAGISEENTSSVFGRFVKLNDFVQGTGLGLSICKAIINIGGGEIGVDSKLGEGSTFWIWLPCEAEHIVNKNDVLNVSTDLAEKQNIVNLPQIGDGIALKSLDILVAEDNDSNYLLLKSILKGYNLTRAVNGVKVVELAKERKFNLILMDLKMPIMDGLEATKLIREFDKDIKIIAVTANVFDSDRASAIKIGCNRFVSKPLNKTKLLEAMLS